MLAGLGRIRGVSGGTVGRAALFRRARNCWSQHPGVLHCSDARLRRDRRNQGRAAVGLALESRPEAIGLVSVAEPARTTDYGLRTADSEQQRIGRRVAFDSESMASDTTSNNLSRFLLGLRPHFEGIAQPDTSPYDAGRTVWATAFSNRDCRDVSHALWLIWGGANGYGRIRNSSTCRSGIQDANGCSRMAGDIHGRRSCREAVFRSLDT